MRTCPGPVSAGEGDKLSLINVSPRRANAGRTGTSRPLSAGRHRVDSSARPAGRTIPLEVARVMAPRFMDGHRFDPETGCILSTKKINPTSGYSSGKVPVVLRDAYGIGFVYAHRVAWTNERGEIPPGMTVDHLCFRPACIRVDHMELVTLTVNILRSRNPAANNARKTHCPSGHELPKRTADAPVRRECKQCRDSASSERRRAKRGQRAA